MVSDWNQWLKPLDTDSEPDPEGIEFEKPRVKPAGRSAQYVQL
jgi:hypothetical protein